MMLWPEHIFLGPNHPSQSIFFELKPMASMGSHILGHNFSVTFRPRIFTPTLVEIPLKNSSSVQRMCSRDIPIEFQRPLFLCWLYPQRLSHVVSSIFPSLTSPRQNIRAMFISHGLSQIP